MQIKPHDEQFAETDLLPKGPGRFLGRLLLVIFGLGAIAMFFFKPAEVPQGSAGKDKDKPVAESVDQSYSKDKSLFESIPNVEIEKELGWTGGKWKFKRSDRSGTLEARGHDVVDEDFKDLVSAEDFQLFTLTMESRATGSGLCYLKGRKLTRFWSMSNFFNDEGARCLREFPDITSVKLQAASDLSASGFASIAKLPNLSSVELKMMFKLKPGSIKALSTCPTISQMTLEAVAPFSLSDLEDLKKLPRLRNLHLNGVKSVDDSYIPVLTTMKLSRLEIAMTRISDRGLAKLARMKRLKTLGLTLTTDDKIEEMKESTDKDEVDAISKEGLASFKKARPDCKVKMIKSLAGLDLF